MIRFMVGALILAGAISLSYGRIGETRAEYHTQYGAGKEIGEQMLYSVGEFDLTVFFKESQSIMEIFAKRNTGTGVPEMTPAEKANLLDLNGKGQSWNQLTSKKNDETWRRTDGRVVARYNSSKKVMTFLATGK
jgi:hypothetical protein